jgi:hypothetical protein
MPRETSHHAQMDVDLYSRSLQLIQPHLAWLLDDLPPAPYLARDVVLVSHTDG